jgi:GDP-mannose 6-dehydrogenase
MDDTSGGARVAVFGLGYIGCVTAACLARLGHRVTGVDVDDLKVGTIREGRAPFREPGLDEIVLETVRSGKLKATTSTAEALEESDIALLCVGTPSERNGNIGLAQLRRVSEQIARALPPAKPLVVAVRSTVFPGVCEDVVQAAFRADQKVSVVSNPEFLREGCAVRDFLEPSLVVVGGTDAEAVRRVAALYSSLPGEVCQVSLRTAEMIKYACNSFHAVKIAFANEIGAFCSRLEIDAREVMDVVCRDRRLNISPAYLKPGFAYGGSCLPKDLRALNFRAGRLDLALPLLSNVPASNDEHLRRATEAVLDLPVQRISIFGLAFKENTDDLRESPVVSLIETLIGKGRDLRIWDPNIELERIYGSNREFILSAVPHIRRLLAGSLDELLAWSDHVVLAQKPDNAVLERLAQPGRVVIDLVGAREFRVPAPAAFHA